MISKMYFSMRLSALHPTRKLNSLPIAIISPVRLQIADGVPTKLINFSYSRAILLKLCSTKFKSCSFKLAAIAIKLGRILDKCKQTSLYCSFDSRCFKFPINIL
eukprot:NODE_5_length_72347_cov_1.339331.p61 type:complete len:104 gc:universal NODE_5_length_72347_cov_1.339331:13566-13255(-)